MLLKTGIIPDLGTISLIVTAAGVVGALACVLGGARHAGSASCSSGRPAAASCEPARGAGHAAGGIIHSRAVPH